MRGNRVLSRLDEMLTEAINGSFAESRYDETELSRLESKFRQYLTERELAAERVQAERAAIKELVTDISHQTKTPIANICLYTQLLEEKSPQELKPYVQQIHQQAEKLEFLIQSLTKLSRLESNIVEVKPVRQELSGLLAESLEDIRPKAEKKEIELCCAYVGSVSAFYDKKWTKEALGNVLDNAVKYSPESSRIQISVMEYEMYAAISVKDHGIGIREEDTAKIFRRFYRADALQQEDGAGIGLYLAREIVRRENGYIKVKSKEGKGSEFVLYLRKEDI